VTKIAIEESLQYMKPALIEKGYDVITLQDGTAPEDCDCCIISGMDENMMGIQTAVTQAPVIDARGMNVDEVCEQVSHHLQ
jgi:hypothetical protein